jgi:hypothetical protein
VTGEGSAAPPDSPLAVKDAAPRRAPRQGAPDGNPAEVARVPTRQIDIDGGIPGDRGRIRGNRDEGEGSRTIGGQSGLILLRRQSSDEESRGTIA